jgi:UDP-N-acetylglucosamine 3-dehydrogenase
MQRVRIGVIGVGLFGGRHVAALSDIPYVDVAAVADPDALRLDEVATRYRVARRYANGLDLAADAELDAVVVATPEAMHRDYVLSALEHGKHVLVEKPIATDVVEAEEMVRAAERTGRYLVPGHLLRFETRFAMVKERLQRGTLGRVVSIGVRRDRGRALVAKYLRTHPFLEVSIHDVDLLLWYVGDRVRRVRGYQRQVQQAPYPDVVWGFVEFAGGAIACLEQHWLLPEQGGLINGDTLHLVGSAGMAALELAHPGVEFYEEGGYHVPDVSYDPTIRGAARGALYDQDAYFAACVLRGETPSVVTARDALEGLRVVDALIRSANEDREVELG